MVSVDKSEADIRRQRVVGPTLHPTVCPAPASKIDEFANDASRGRRVVWVTELLGRPIVGPEHQHLGHVHDVVAHRLPDSDAVVTGLLADVGGHTIVGSAAAVRGWEASSGALEVLRHRRGYCRRPDEVLLAAHVLGRPVMTSTAPTLARVVDIALRRSAAGWTVWAVDTRSAVQRVLGAPRRLVEWRTLAQRRVAAPRQTRATGDGSSPARPTRRRSR